jgi:hypothetical protein
LCAARLEKCGRARQLKNLQRRGTIPTKVVHEDYLMTVCRKPDLYYINNSTNETSLGLHPRVYHIQPDYPTIEMNL